MGALTPETCTVTLQWNKSDCIHLHLLWIMMHATMSLKFLVFSLFPSHIRVCCHMTLVRGPALLHLMSVIWSTKYPSGVDLSGRTVEGVGLRSLSCWDCGFESRRKLGCLSLVNVSCRVLCVGRITRPGGILQSVVYLSMIVKSQQWRGLSTRGVVAPWEKKICTLQGNLKFITLVIASVYLFYDNFAQLAGGISF